jgi:hypothetical protein
MNLSDNGLQNISLLFSITVLAILLFGFMISNSGVLAQGPDFNFSDITGDSGMDLSSLSSLLSSFKPVNGTYSNPDFGFEIILPNAWQGSEYSSPEGKIAFVSSPDVSAEMSAYSAMTISFLDNRNNTALSRISNITNVLGGDPSSAGDTTNPNCKLISATPVTINNIKAESIDLQCENMYLGAGENASARSKSITFVTGDDSLISVSFVASPEIYERLAKI